jgi:hypothetical protein
MTGGTPQYNRISGNLYITLSLALKAKPYETFHIDQRLWIPAANLHTYPDVMVVSKPIELKAGRKDTVLILKMPKLLIEFIEGKTNHLCLIHALV